MLAVDLNLGRETAGDDLAHREANRGRRGGRAFDDHHLRVWCQCVRVGERASRREELQVVDSGEIGEAAADVGGGASGYRVGAAGEFAGDGGCRVGHVSGSQGVNRSLVRRSDTSEALDGDRPSRNCSYFAPGPSQVCRSFRELKAHGGGLSEPSGTTPKDVALLRLPPRNLRSSRAVQALNRNRRWRHTCYHRNILLCCCGGGGRRVRSTSCHLVPPPE